MLFDLSQILQRQIFTLGLILWWCKNQNEQHSDNLVYLLTLKFALAVCVRVWHFGAMRTGGRRGRNKWEGHSKGYGCRGFHCLLNTLCFGLLVGQNKQTGQHTHNHNAHKLMLSRYDVQLSVNQPWSHPFVLWTTVLKPPIWHYGNWHLVFCFFLLPDMSMELVGDILCFGSVWLLAQK